MFQAEEGSDVSEVAHVLKINVNTHQSFLNVDIFWQKQTRTINLIIYVL